ncbi:hypothetical protein BJ944DRAFT_259709 [Cunninghamella echinulata]|nr:hypothetical protein BJ944DRAFT_259709 [Cunninghamella echinulata]
MDSSFSSTNSLEDSANNITSLQHDKHPTSSNNKKGANKLPQPQNSNHISSAPLKEKLLTNSSYLAAEIPLKLGHFMNHLWMSGSEFLNDSITNQQTSLSFQATDNKELWLLGCKYDMPDHLNINMQQDMMEAQKDDIFKNEMNDLSENDLQKQQSSIYVSAPSSISSKVSVNEIINNEQDSTHESNDTQLDNKPNTAVMSLLWPPDFYNDFTSRFWMTYRYNYPPIRPSHYKTDIGWGCMLRSGQSLLANALLIHFLNRDWRRAKDKSDPTWRTYVKIAHWFLDELSPRAPFSIHRIALLGKQLGKNIGEWFGPSTISQVIQALVSDFPPAKMAVYIATDGVIYRNDVFDVSTGKKPRGEFGYLMSKAHADTEKEEARKIYNQSSSIANSNSSNTSTIDITTTTTIPSTSSSVLITPTFKSTLILVAVRLGIDHLHPTYYPALKACFQLPSFVGIAGGRPNSSLYFMGLQNDELIYIDPHFSRCALETKELMEYTEEDLATYHCTIPRKIHISQIDPSMLLGFYCRTEDDFNTLCEQIEEINQHYTAIFSIQDNSPGYDEDERSENDFGIVSDDEEEEIASDRESF